MGLPFADKHILLGITGGIAVYKVAEWCRALTRDNANVNVVMTGSATNFVSPVTFAALTRNRVHLDMFERSGAEKIPHISLAKNSDIIVVAPATANTIARLANGLADNLLTTVILAAEPSKVVVCPAMNCNMFNHPATKANIAKLEQFGYTIIAPDSGSLACGEEGPGRLAEWTAVRDILLEKVLTQDLAGRSVLVTAGPTSEPLDPVRFIGNRSSGKMGYALAAAARNRGAKVLLISGPVSLPPPNGVECIKVNTALEMHATVMANYQKVDAVVMAAAVSDYRAREIHVQKIKKGRDELTCSLLANPDILKELGQLRENQHPFPFLIGFAAETENHLAEGERKLRAKNLDLIAVNDVAAADAGFAVDTNRVTLLSRSGEQQELPLLTKEETAHRILDNIAALLAE